MSQYVLIMDALASATNSIAVIVLQLPNCPIIYANDKTHRERFDMNFYAHSIGEFMRDIDLDPRKINIFPIVKGGFMGMKAVK